MHLSGSPFDFLIAFAGGLAASLTPCVYPLIPVSAGYIIGNTEGSKLKGLTLSLAYVTGMAVTYSALGVVAVLTGTFFGKISSNPVVYLLVGIAIVFFGASMLGLFNLNLHILKLPALKKGNHLSTFLLGLFSGLAVTPCLTPVLGSILAYLMTQRNILYGWLLLFCFSYGMGIIFIAVGTFGSLFIGLPKSGRWMQRIEKIFAWLIILMGMYFIFTAIRRF